jgi:hypothetical protein
VTARGAGAMGSDASTIMRLLRTDELLRAGLPRPDGAPSPKWMRRAMRNGWVLLPRLARVARRDLQALERAASSSPLLEVGMAEPPRLLGIFRRKPEPAARWVDDEGLEALLADDPMGLASAVEACPMIASWLSPSVIEARRRGFELEARALPGSHRILAPARSREELLHRADPSLSDLYAREYMAQSVRRRPPSTPLRFSEGYPARDLPSAIRLLVSVRAPEVAERLRSGTLASWFRDEAGDDELAAVIDAAAHSARDRGEDDEDARARLLQYLRRTAAGADLERGLVEHMAEGLRSRDSARVAQTAEALLLLDPDLAASELAQALFETDPACRGHVVSALGETGSPRAVDALERLGRAATRAEDREGALAALRRLSAEGASGPVASAALERLGTR